MVRVPCSVPASTVSPGGLARAGDRRNSDDWRWRAWLLLGGFAAASICCRSSFGRVFHRRCTHQYCVGSWRTKSSIALVYAALTHVSGSSLSAHSLREDDPAQNVVEEELVADAPGAADHDGQVVRDRQQTDALVGAGLAPEEIHEDALAAGVLVGDEAQRAALLDDLGHHLGGPLLVDQFEPMPLPQVVQETIEVLVVQRAGDAVDIEAKKARHVPDELEVAVMGRHHDQALALLHHPFRVFRLREARVLTPVVLLDQPRRDQHVDGQHDKLLEAAPPGLLDPLLGFLRETGPQVVQGPLPAPFVIFPQEIAQEARKPQTGPNIDEVKNDHHEPNRRIEQPVANGMWFFLFFLLRFLRISHSS